MLSGSHFGPSSVRWRRCYPDPLQLENLDGQFQFQWADHSGSHALAALRFSNPGCRINGTDGPTLVPGWNWRDAQSSGSWPKPDLIQAAVRVFLGIAEQRRFFHAYFRQMSDATQWEQQIAACADKPARVGGLNQDVTVIDDPLVVLTNQSWNVVNVEVRRGGEPECGKNAAFETRQLLYQESWEIPAPDVDVCYRRDIDPDLPDGSWTSWRRVSAEAPKPAFEPIA